jgi:hypothetical protein
MKVQSKLSINKVSAEEELVIICGRNGKVRGKDLVKEKEKLQRSLVRNSDGQ